MHDAIVVGSGAAGTFASYGLRGLKTLVVDVGLRPAPSARPSGNLYELRRIAHLFELLIGSHFESLHNIENAELSPKLKSPLMRYVIARPEGAPEIDSPGFHALATYAEGGLAEAWGAQVYRFDHRDLAAFPIGAEDLEPYYAEIAAHIGISGANDDLTAYVGDFGGMLQPLPLSRLGRDVLRRYERRRRGFHRQGIYLGRPRLAVLASGRGSRPGISLDGWEFFLPRNPAVYSPVFTLRQLIEQDAVDYLPNHLVESYRECPDCVEVLARDLQGGTRTTLRGRALLLCLGALNTARLVLASHEDHETRLPIVSNPCSFTPLLDLRSVGSSADPSSFPAQVCLAVNTVSSDSPVIGMVYTTEGLLRSDLLFEFPFSVRGCLAAARYLLPAMALVQIFYPAEPRTQNAVHLGRDGGLKVEFQEAPVAGVEAMVIRAFRSIGYFGSMRLVRRSRPGMSIHYAGPLPMRVSPREMFETDRVGLLSGSRRVYVADAACFPRLPAKNLTFTIMANAMRIGAAVRREIESSR